MAYQNDMCQNKSNMRPPPPILDLSAVFHNLEEPTFLPLADSKALCLFVFPLEAGSPVAQVGLLTICVA